MYKYLFSFLSMAIVLQPIHAQSEIDNAFSLKEAINYGLQAHPSLKLAHNSLRKSKQTSRDALSAYLPQVSLQSTLDYNYKLQTQVIPAGVFGPEEQRISFGNKYASNTVIQLDQKIYDQSLIVGLKANKPNEELNALDMDIAEEDIIYNIANAYYSILIAKEQIKLLNANKDRFTELLRIVELQKEYGVANNVDVNQVKVNLSNIESQLSILENNISLGDNQLKNAMGMKQEVPIILSDSTNIVNEAINKQQLQTSREFDYSQTIAYTQQKLLMELYDINIKSIKYSVLPKVGFYARYGGNGFDQNKIFKAYDPLLGFGSLGLSLQWGIFTGFKRDAAYRTAIIDRENLDINFEINKDRMELQFKNSTNNFKRALSTIETNKKNVALAQEVYDNTNLQYKQGVASLSQMMNAELSLREANNNYSQSLIDYFKADLELNRSNGTLKSFVSSLK